jgi:hypothetical protein
VASGSIRRVRTRSSASMGDARARGNYAIASRVSRPFRSPNNIGTVDQWLNGLRNSRRDGQSYSAASVLVLTAGMVAFGRLRDSITIGTRCRPSAASTSDLVGTSIHIAGDCVGAVQESKWAVEGGIRRGDTCSPTCSAGRQSTPR